MTIQLMQNMDLQGKRVVIREDLNVPMKDGIVRNDKRVRAALPTIRMALEKGAAVILLSHLGRPVEGEFEEKFSLRPVAAHLEKLLGAPVTFVPATTADFSPSLTHVDVQAGQCYLCENVRFAKGEKKNNADLAQKMADLGDVYVMDAFGASHRAHASTEGAVRRAKQTCAGPLMAQELSAFAKVQDNPTRPLIAIIGGSKVSTKLSLLENLLTKVDKLIVGGGIANTFLAAAGYNVGKSLYEEELLPEARRIMEQAKALGKDLPLPVDVVVAAALEAGQKATTYALDTTNAVPDDAMILDIGPKTVQLYADICASAATIIWNGPVGAFETDPFGAGTQALAQVLADGSAFVVVGGGDSVAAVEQYGLAHKMGYISTGGGASLELLEGKTLPAVAALEAAE